MKRTHRYLHARRAGFLGKFMGIALALSVALGILQAVQHRQSPSESGWTPPEDLTLRKARWRVLGRRPLGMYYYTDGQGLDSLNKNAAQMSVLAPQCYWLDANGMVKGQIPAAVQEVAQRENLPLMPLVINPGFDRTIASAVLRNPEAQERAITYLASLAEEHNFVGWQLDLEFIDPADKDLYTQFVRRLARHLHRDRRLLSVAVIPRFSDDYPSTNAPGEFRTGEWGAPYDYRRLGRVVDFMSIMAYNHHHPNAPPGPIAPHPWVKATLDYAVRRVRHDKLLLGIPFYGREWEEENQQKRSRSLRFSEAKAQMERLKLTPRWHEGWRSPWFQYREGDTSHTVWFENSRSLKEKLELMRDYRLRGFAAWRLGSEDPEFWTLLAAEQERTGNSSHMPKGEKPGRDIAQQGSSPRPHSPGR